jgi:hypothetical protein
VRAIPHPDREADAPWGHLAPRTRGAVAAHVVAVVVGGLALERSLGMPGQHLATAWTLGVFAWLAWLGGAAERRALIACTVLAGIGEAVLALGWGLYDYRFGNLPAYVPPGHALLMALGLVVRPLVTARVIRGIAVAAAAWGAWGVVAGHDVLGAALTLGFLAAVRWGGARDLYAAMFVLALAMELYGTAVGGWTWRGVVPGLGWAAANPPLGAGAFYCLLDLLVLAIAAPAVGRRAAIAAVRAEVPMPGVAPLADEAA